MGIIRTLPVVALRGLAILPNMVAHFDVSRTKSVKAVEDAMMRDQKVFLVGQKDAAVEQPGLNDLFVTGTIASIKQIVKLPKNMVRVLVEGEERAELICFSQSEPFLAAEVEPLESGYAGILPEGQKAAMLRTLKEVMREYGALNPKMNKDVLVKLLEINELDRLVDQVCISIPIEFADQQKLLDAVSIEERYDVLTVLLTNEMLIAQYTREIQEKVKERIDKNQREYFLREQLKLIREELGDDTFLSDADMFSEAAEKLNAPDEVKEKLKKEIGRFKNCGNNYNAETGVIRTYIETMLDMPWDNMSVDNDNLGRAGDILNEDHYGLENVKERVLEYLAVRILAHKGESPILCLVGPPGTGKSSIAKSIARALDKKYVRISLGGIRDEAEIRGHRKTYVGAMPGRIANGLKMAGTKNPLMLLDEIDKVSTDYKGDTFSALLEVLDSEQNQKFRDHYLEVPVDLSQVMFITTANTTETIPRPLLDRMEVIEIGSYTENEKVHIATEHLLPRQLDRHGLKKTQLSLSKKALESIIRYYTKEAGVRQLERKLGEISRKSARIILEQGEKKVSVSDKNLEKILGKKKYRFQKANTKNDVGIVRGLAWTSVGGDTLSIEVNVMEGKGDIILTGQLGDVMKESAQAGVSYIRSVASKYDIKPEFFKEHDIHVHIPEGAVPKDGPSAGITMATAMLSAITEKEVRFDTAMTGEITLRGRVLPIGGLKEKLLAAKNAGIRMVIVPSKNEADIAELSEEITDGLEIKYVDSMDQVIELAMVK